MTDISTEQCTAELLVRDWVDCCSAIALLHMGPDDEPNDLVKRARAAVEAEDVADMLHVSALILPHLDPGYPHDRWLELNNRTPVEWR